MATMAKAVTAFFITAFLVNEAYGTDDSSNKGHLRGSGSDGQGISQSNKVKIKDSDIGGPLDITAINNVNGNLSNLFTHEPTTEPTNEPTFWYTCSDVTIVPALNMCDSLCMETAQSYAFTVANAVIAGGPISVSSVYFESITIDSKDHPDYLLLASRASVNRCENPVQTEVFIDTETDKMIGILKLYAAQEQPAMYCRDPATNFSALVQSSIIIDNFSSQGSVNIASNINASALGMSRGSSGTNPAIEFTINNFLQVEPGTLQVFQATFIGNTYLSPESRISYNASLRNKNFGPDKMPPKFVIGELNCVPSVVGSIVVAQVQYTLSNLGPCAKIAAKFDLYNKIVIDSFIIATQFPGIVVTLSDYGCFEGGSSRQRELAPTETVQTITFEGYCNAVGVTDCTDNGAAALAIAATNINIDLGAQIIANSVKTDLESIFSQIDAIHRGVVVTYGVLSATAEPTMSNIANITDDIDIVSIEPTEEPTAEPTDEPTEEHT